MIDPLLNSLADYSSNQCMKYLLSYICGNLKKGVSMKKTYIALMISGLLFFSDNLFSQNTAQQSSSGKWWNNAVFYEIFVRSFYDSNGDGIGDLKGLIQKLDYLNDGKGSSGKSMGIDAVWLMPIFECKGDVGYTTLDYFTINKKYGTIDDFQKLITEAHKRKIKIILDLVINHTSDQHPWFLASRSGDSAFDNYYVWRSFKPAGWRGSWIKDDVRNDYYYSFFAGGRPDLNHKNPEVFNEVKKIVKFWLDKGIDGFRLDAASFLIEEGPGNQQADTGSTIEYWAKINEYVKSINPNALMIAEIYAKDDILLKYKKEKYGIDLCFDFGLAKKIVQLGNGSDARDVTDIIANRIRLKSPLNYFSPLLSNHDQERVMSRVQNNPKKAGMLASLLLTLPGSPFIYYGEEIGLTEFPFEKKTDGRMHLAPMQWNSSANAGFSTVKPWAPIATDSKEVNVRNQENKRFSLLNTYKILIDIRKKYPEFTDGRIEIVDCNSKKIILFKRISDNGSYSFVSINTGETDEELSVNFLPQKKFADLFSGKSVQVINGTIHIPAYGFLILKDMSE
jgi:alpha-amylase